MKKFALFLIPLLGYGAHYTDAFDPNRHSACQQAKEKAKAIPNLLEYSGCSCEKIDYDGWRCLVRYTLKAADSKDAPGR